MNGMAGIDGRAWGCDLQPDPAFEEQRRRFEVERYNQTNGPALADRIADRLNGLQRGGAEQRWQGRQRRGLNAELECSPLALAGAALEAGDLMEAESLVNRMAGPEAATGSQSRRITKSAELCDKVRTAHGRFKAEFSNKGLQRKIATCCGCSEKTVQRVVQELNLTS